VIGDAVERLGTYRSRPWLVLGKGPSLDLRDCFDLDRFHVLALNHACRVWPATCVHFMDLEAYLDCRADVLSADGVVLPHVPDVVLPWVPHRNMGPGHFTLEELVRDGWGGLDHLAAAGRLWSYNSTRVPRQRHHPGLRRVRVRYFSAVAAFNLLALAGCKEVYTLGIDGGTSYAAGMDPRHCLANGRDSFDCQFQEIQRTLARHHMVWVNLAALA
jgi:hypothetical protein